MNLKTSLTNDVLTVTLNRPDLHNAFNPDMIAELTQTFKNATPVNGVRAVILRGEGKSFCAGADLNWMKSMAQFTYEENLKDSEKLYEMFETIAKCPAPVIGRVHGSVFGGGVGLASVCDFVASHKETKFCFSEAKLGLVPAVISPFVLRRSRASAVRHMMLTAQIFDEIKALEMGLITFVGQNDEEVDDWIQSQVDFVKACGPEALRDTKHLLDFVPRHDWEHVKRETTMVISERRVSVEGQEGLQSFLSKRKPNWKK